VVLIVVAVGLAHPEPGRPIKVIIDADPAIGTPFKDVDDGLMLLTALNSPELDILGITTTFGNASQEVSYRTALELVERAGRTDIPVLRGAERADSEGTPTEASRFIADMAARHPGEVVVLAVGPVTNVATALRHSPETAEHLREVVSMGGNVSAANVANTQCYTDLNYGSDAESAGLFLESIDNLTVVSIEVSQRFFISPARYRQMLATTQHADYLRESTRFWYWLQRRSFVVWDLVALACLINPHWFVRNEVAIDYVAEDQDDPRLLPASHPQQYITVNIPEYRAPQEQFWEWAFSRM
jgi:inosine-uridine nucleoside N-ribohydrolase